MDVTVMDDSPRPNGSLYTPMRRRFQELKERTKSRSSRGQGRGGDAQVSKDAVLPQTQAVPSSSTPRPHASTNTAPQPAIESKDQDRVTSAEAEAPTDQPVQVSAVVEPKSSKAQDQSNELWNVAFDQLEIEEETAQVVISYKETIAELLATEEIGAGAAPGPVKLDRAARDAVKAKLLADLDDRTRRQELMVRFVRKGQDKAKASKTRERIGDVADAILKAKPVVNIALQVPHAAPAALPWAGVLVGLQILANPGKAKKSNLDGISYVCSRMEWYSALCSHILAVSIRDTAEQLLEKKIVDLYKAILFYQMKSVCTYYKNQGLVFLQDLSNWNDWDELLKKVKDAEQTLDKDSAQLRDEQEKAALNDLVGSARLNEQQFRVMHQDIHQALQELVTSQKDRYENEKSRQYLKDLFVLYPPDDMDRIKRTKGGLLASVFNWVLDTSQYALFTSWTDGDSVSQTQLLWVKGLPGIGKTMIMIGIIRELADQTAAVAPSLSYYFCQGTDDQAQNSATAILRSLIWMLIIQQPELITHLIAEHDRQNRDEIFNDKRNALEAALRVFKNMLADINSAYLIVDALDECEENLDRLLELIATSVTTYKNVRWLVSSRPNIDVVAQLQKCSTDPVKDKIQILDLDTENLDAPVSAYVDYKLSSLKHRPSYTADVLNQLSSEIRGRTGKTFLWVALVFDVLDEIDVDLEPVHGSSALEIMMEMPPGLQKLYEHMMARIKRKRTRDTQLCKDVLAAIALALRPLSLAELAVVAGLQVIDPGPEHIVKTCGSILSIQSDLIYLVHQSAKDYIIGQLRECEIGRPSQLDSTTTDVYIDITRRSIHAMTTFFCHRRYRYDEQDRPVSGQDLSALQYSCIHFMEHVCIALDVLDQDSTQKRVVCGECYDFVTTYCLQWLESLALLGAVSYSIIAMEKLLVVLRASPGFHSELARFLEDVKQFATANRDMMETVPLQTFGGALVFCPKSSEVKQLFWNQRLPYVKSIKGGIADINSSIRHVPVTDAYGSHAATFSPDGTIVATNIPQDRVQLWKFDTAVIEADLFGYADRPLSIALSVAGVMVAAALPGGAVDLRNTQSGVQRTLDSSASCVTSLAFSPDSTKLAMALGYDQTAQLWNLEDLTYKVLDGHGDEIQSVAFSERNTLATGAKDGLIHLWDGASGDHKRKLSSNARSIYSVVFSKYGSTVASIASASDDGTADHIEVWDVALKTDTEPDIFNCPNTYAIALSEDGTMLASVSSQGNAVRLWSVRTHQCRIVQRRNPWNPVSLAFLDHGSRLALVWSTYNRLTFKTASTNDKEDGSACHPDPIRSLAISNDGAIIASASIDGTAILWDTLTASQIATIELWSEEQRDWSIRSVDLRPSPRQAGGNFCPRASPLSASALNVRHDWIFRGSSPLLWMPLDYRGVDKSAIRDNVVVLGHSSGHITIIEFDLEAEERFHRDCELRKMQTKLWKATKGRYGIRIVEAGGNGAVVATI